MSRVVNKDRIFGNEEKEFFLRTMRKLEQFMGLQILTYCIMGNHWHILVEVPSSVELNDLQLIDRISHFYSRSQSQLIIREYERVKAYADETGCTNQLDAWRENYLSRMGDLSSFVKELKERFSKWYNRKNNRRGTLWEERYKSVLIEDSDHAVSTIAAYIDLNPIRAGLADDPRNYRFCGYAEAVAGGKSARHGIEKIVALRDRNLSWRQTAARYRSHLFCSGEKTETRMGFDPEKVRNVLENGGELSTFELLRCHIRYFNDGVALGSSLFIEEVFQNYRSLFSERRTCGARKIKSCPEEQLLYSLRNLRVDAISAPG